LAGEVESLDLKEVPVFVISAAGQANQRLTGLVTREQLFKMLP
jgi:hypothetical protein